MKKKLLPIWGGCTLIAVSLTSCTSQGTRDQVNQYLDSLDSVRIADSIVNSLVDSQDAVVPSTGSDYYYQESEDEMTDSKTKYASITSDNKIELDFPYGECQLSYTIRSGKKYGTDVYLVISSGQFYGSEYDGDNYVTVRFDSNKAERYYYTEAADNDTKTIFLNNAKKFIDNAKKATEIKIEVPLYQAGRPIFKFKVDQPLKW